MKRSTILVLVFGVAFALAGGTAWAQGHGQGGGGGRGGDRAHGPGSGPSHPAMMGEHGSRPDTHRDVPREERRRSPGEMLQQNTRLASRLQERLPEGTDLQQAAGGFKNLGQFVAAVNVSHNLNIPFDQLKGTMAGPPPKSLGEAIHELRPEVNAKAEAKKAKKQAKKEMRESGS